MKKVVGVIKLRNCEKERRIAENIKSIKGFLEEESRQNNISVFKFTDGNVELYKNEETKTILISVDTNFSEETQKRILKKIGL